MNVYWLNGGLHAEPESDLEREALMTLWNGVRRDNGHIGPPEHGSTGLGGTFIHVSDLAAVSQ